MPSSPQVFDVDLADLDDSGIVFVGGVLDARWLLAAYRRGIFPWPCFDTWGADLAPRYSNLWCCPNPRWVLDCRQLHVPRRLQRRLRRGEFSFTVNMRFEECVRRCARRGDHMPEQLANTWLSPELEAGYHQLHAGGHALSLEVFKDGRLVGGILGVQLGAFFSAESMFSSERDASKAGLVTLVTALDQAGFSLIDVQQESPHLVHLGATAVSRQTFLDRHRSAIARSPKPWQGRLGGDETCDRR